MAYLQREDMLKMNAFLRVQADGIKKK